MSITLRQLINNPSSIEFHIGTWIFWLAIHVAFAIAIYKDARKIDTVFIGPVLWSISVLLGGYMLAAIYWLMHHSSLAKDAQSEK